MIIPYLHEILAIQFGMEWWGKSGKCNYSILLVVQ